MGKIKIATLGGKEEQAFKEKREVQREEKKKRKEALLKPDSAKATSGREKKVHISGMKGGERVKSVGATEDELDKMVALAREVEKDQTEGIKIEAGEEEKKAKKKKKAKKRGKQYQGALLKLDHQKLYKFSDALPLLRDASFAKFDSSVEVHINTLEKGMRGSVTLPHGSGKIIRIAIADEKTVDKIVEEVSTGKINFDALIAHPTVVGKLAKVAKFLGPKGLMPNPKAGTISPTPEKVAQNLQKGEVNWKTESEFPIIHQLLGKLSFKDKQLEENFNALVKSIGDTKIKNITLKSTMSPGIKIQLS